MASDDHKVSNRGKVSMQVKVLYLSRHKVSPTRLSDNDNRQSQQRGRNFTNREAPMTQIRAARLPKRRMNGRVRRLLESGLL
jgi:hypothetical protein